MVHELTLQEIASIMDNCYLKSKYSEFVIGDEELFRQLASGNSARRGYNITSTSGWDALLEDFRQCEIPVADGEKAVVVINPAEPVTTDMLQRISEMCESKFANVQVFFLPDYKCDRLEKTTAVDCLTIVVYKPTTH